MTPILHIDNRFTLALEVAMANNPDYVIVMSSGSSFYLYNQKSALIQKSGYRL